MRLFICEKASVGKALSNVLPGVKTRDTNFIRCGEDIVAWASGHLLELCEPEDYDSRFRSWSRDTLLYVPETWRYKEKPRTKALLAGLKKLIRDLKGTDVIVNTGDADREGQTLIDELLDYCGWRGKTERLRINDINPDAIRKALGNTRDNVEYRGEYMAGRARMYADWLVGLPMTRFVTVSLREAGYEAGTVSVGRVQTPTLALVVVRDREIEGFSSSRYYELSAAITLGDGRKITGKWQSDGADSQIAGERKRIISREAAAEIAKKLDGAAGEITNVEKKERKSAPPLPYSLSKLQMAASKKYDITDTLKHAHKLYESGYITYPRAGCEYIPEGHFAEAGRVMDAIRAACPSLEGMIAGTDLHRKSVAWDNSRISEHHAIIPTTRVPLEGSLSANERKIYELVCARYALQFLADCQYEETIIEFTGNGEVFRATGRTVINLGWQGWDKQNDQNGSDNGKNGEHDDETSDPPTLPFVRQGEAGVIKPSVEERMTSPPKPYTYHALIGSMNNIHVYIKDPAIRAKLKEIQGIGTEATQEAVIATLFERGYIEKKKQNICSTSLGRHLIDILSGGEGAKRKVLVEPDMTALWEAAMTEIEAGNERLEDFVSDVAGMTREIISDPLQLPFDIPGLPKKKRCLTDGCDGYLNHVQREGKRSFFSCPLCRKTFSDINGEPVPRKEYSAPVIEAACPLRCGKQARRYKSEYGYYWRCDCSPDETFKDVDGQPAAPTERARASCPVRGCGGTAVRFQARAGDRLFWKCPKCGNFFDDKDGEPVIKDRRKKGGYRGNDARREGGGSHVDTTQ